MIHNQRFCETQLLARQQVTINTRPPSWIRHLGSAILEVKMQKSFKIESIFPFDSKHLLCLFKNHLKSFPMIEEAQIFSRKMRASYRSWSNYYITC